METPFILLKFAYATSILTIFFLLSIIAANTDKWYKWDILRIYLTKRVKEAQSEWRTKHV